MRVCRRGCLRVATIGFLLFTFAVQEPAALAEVPDEPQAEQETVVLLHGLGRSWRSMKPLESRLSAEGYKVHNFAYPSRDMGPDELALELQRQVEECCSDSARLHFIGHSLGAILIRMFLAENRPDSLGRVVMLSPPNHGSEIIDSMGESWIFENVMGPAAEQLGTGPDSLPNTLPPADYEVGVIAGSASVNPVGSIIIPGDDDGMVSVCSMRLDGMTDFIVINKTHAFIMQSTTVTAQILEFLRNGRFVHDDDSKGIEDLDCPNGDSVAVTSGQGG
jgi:pimeloyl-ACP methyl ester carboxylesterase